MTKVVYSPIIHNGRRQISIYDTETQKLTSTSYARYLMEQHLGRRLDPDEEVHHKDGDKLNDSLNNLEVLLVSEHKIIHSGRQVYVCPVCLCQFERRVSTVERRKRQGFQGPFCSISCSSQGRNQYKRSHEGFK